jgi:hypothetical protein
MFCCLNTWEVNYTVVVAVDWCPDVNKLSTMCALFSLVMHIAHCVYRLKQYKSRQLHFRSVTKF